MHGRNKTLDYAVGLLKRPACGGTFVFFYVAKSNTVITLIFMITRYIPQSQIIKLANSCGY